ncbi:uncharacterized protein LOC120067490 [Benincasa hispida]|uniref:uncharacterized protein LOC120067490 n=1 Tax=Benincasa hispida TaxID=102211 RepID=UPI001900538A|nr:uncharacterized protein LOC120067490 [Benincasa hispida]
MRFLRKLKANMGNKNSIFNNENSSLVIRTSRDEKPLHYTLKIQSFSLLKAAVAASSIRNRYESQIFKAGGYKWKLALYPNGDFKRNVANHISLYLVSAEDEISSSGLEIKVMIKFLVYDNLKDRYWTIQDGKVRCFHAIKKEWGFEKLVSLDTFNDTSNGLLVDDCCAFGVDVIVMKSYDGNNEILSLIKQLKNYKYTWKINNFSQLSKNVYESDPFTVDNYTWKIELYPRGDSLAMTGYMSMFLRFDSFEKLPQGSRVYVEYDIAVLSQLGGAYTNYPVKHWFDGETKSWGFGNFMSLSNVKEPMKGFLCDDTLMVEVKINVISILKSFYRKGNGGGRS